MAQLIEATSRPWMTGSGGSMGRLVEATRERAGWGRPSAEGTDEVQEAKDVALSKRTSISGRRGVRARRSRRYAKYEVGGEGVAGQGLGWDARSRRKMERGWWILARCPSKLGDIGTWHTQIVWEVYICDPRSAPPRPSNDASRWCMGASMSISL
ncbi:hypothetical protein BGZ63DRAFT_141195 [Mariannaea sp. PMI_226]|nr:hypothetical protein BGZ63DRAFT_141195 [Mariannaea sp. PMI_226]